LSKLLLFLELSSFTNSILFVEIVFSLQLYCVCRTHSDRHGNVGDAMFVESPWRYPGRLRFTESSR